MASSSTGGTSDIDLDQRMILEAQLSVLPENLPRFPWESGPFRAIFEDEGLVAHPILRQPILLDVPGEPLPPESPAVRVEGNKRKFASLYEHCNSAKSCRRDDDDDGKLWDVALAKWVAVFALINHEGSVGEQLQQSFWDDQGPPKEEIIRDVEGPRAPRTAIKRANSILKCLRWHLDHYEKAWPWCIQSVSAFADSLKGSKGEGSAVQSLFEAIRFTYHVMGVPFPQQVLSDKRLQGRAKRLAFEGPDLRQADPLSAGQVCKLERMAVSSDTCCVDRYLVGGLLFALYSRSRWSDLRYIQSICVDRAPDGSGFVEARTRVHKTRHSKKASKVRCLWLRPS